MIHMQMSHFEIKHLIFVYTWKWFRSELNTLFCCDIKHNPVSQSVQCECFSTLKSSLAVLMSEAEQFRGRSGDARSDWTWCHCWWCHGVRSEVTRLMWRARIGDKTHTSSHLIISEVLRSNEMTSPTAEHVYRARKLNKSQNTRQALADVSVWRLWEKIKESRFRFLTNYVQKSNASD